MSDLKSRLPDFKELSSMACKLFSGIKKSVDEIISDYKEKRAEPEAEKETTAKPATEAKKPKARAAKKAEPKH